MSAPPRVSYHRVLASRRVTLTETVPAAPPPASADGTAPPAAADATPAPTKRTINTIEFLCKFEYQSYRMLEWLPLSVMQEAAEGKLRGHWRRHDASPADPEVMIVYSP